jgi:hypothetical protein
MTSLPSNFPRWVRIRSGEFGASARAMHRVAAFENVSSATIERKTMSTKTTFKRVALVAVAALGIGMVSAVPSNAAATTITFADVHVASAGSQIVGGQATVSITVDTGTATNTVTNITISGAGSFVSAAAVSGSPTFSSGATAGSTSFTMTLGGTSPGTGNLVFTSSVAGTTTITANALDSNGSPTGAVTKTITWTTGATNAVVNHSTAFLNSVIGSESVAELTTAISTPAAVSATAAGRIDVRQYATADSSLPTALASTSAVTVSIAGAGSVGTGGSGTGPSVTIAAGTALLNTVYVYPNGVAGTGTITASVGGVVVKTWTVTFVGTLASYSATPTLTVIGVGSTDPVAINGLDTNANAAALSTVYLTSSNPAVASVSATATSVTSSTATANVLGVAVGTAVITVANASSSPTITKTFTVTVGKATIKTLTMTTDKASYAAGEKVTLTVTAIGSDGLAVGDGALNAFSTAGVTANVAITGTLPGTAVAPLTAGQVAFVGGVATYTIYAPVIDGTVTLTGTEGTATDSTTKAAVSVSFDVVNSSTSAAVDAANAATDAANYAADAADAATTAAQEATAAAQAAQDSADAATAAVVALGIRFEVLYAALHAQMTSLSRLLVRIIKKGHF